MKRSERGRSAEAEGAGRARRERNLLISVREGVLLRVEAAALLLGIGRSTMFELIRQGEIPVVRIGRRTLVHRDDLERFAQARRQE